MDGLHVAIVMDGNGRWARMRGKARTAGHREGTRAVRRVVEVAPDFGIGTLTLYAFSSDNWHRPRQEVRTLFGLLRRHLVAEAQELADSGVRLSAIGRRDRLPASLVRTMEAVESLTAPGQRLHLRLAVDYSSKDSILWAARSAVADGDADLDREAFARRIGRAIGGEEPAGDVDLLIRTGGERRLSDFLLWECAYAELHFTDVMWPEFGAADLDRAVRDYRGRQRRFGRVPDVPIAPPTDDDDADLAPSA